jgi:hypothetical protein
MNIKKTNLVISIFASLLVLPISASFLNEPIPDVGPDGLVGFDIQEAKIKRTQESLEDGNSSKIKKANRDA